MFDMLSWILGTRDRVLLCCRMVATHNVCVCVCACVRACVCACVSERVRNISSKLKLFVRNTVHGPESTALENEHEWTFDKLINSLSASLDGNLVK